MIHTNTITKYNGTLEELAENIGDLYYDSLSEFLQLLSQKLEKDSLKDREKERIKLANSLKEASENIKNSASNISDAWDICEPYLKNK
jgi:NurA-like 5'-3' nuclease